MMAGVMGDLKRICINIFFVAGTVQEPFLAEMFGAQGIDFLKGIICRCIKLSIMPRSFFVSGAIFYII